MVTRFTLGANLVAVSTLLVLPAGAHRALADSEQRTSPGPGPTLDVAAPDRVAGLLRSHGCWSGPAPDPGVIPAHAVVTLPGRAAELTTSQVGFDIWLGPDGTPSTGDERVGKLHGFCR